MQLIWPKVGIIDYLERALAAEISGRCTVWILPSHLRAGQFLGPIVSWPDRAHALCFIFEGVAGLAARLPNTCWLAKHLV